MSGTVLAPLESGTQLLRLPAPEFEKRCLKTEGVSTEQAKAFRSKLWQLHVDSQKAKAAPLPPAGVDLDEANYDRTCSKDPDPRSIAIPFKERIRPGMVVSWTPPAGFPFTMPGMNVVMVLSAAEAVGEDVRDVFGKTVGGEGRKGKFLCAMVGPAVMPEAYDVHLWQQVVVDVAMMDAEVILEYDMATRYYYLTI